MQEFLRETFYVLLFLGLYGTAALLWFLASLVNKWADRGEEERARFIAELEEADQRAEARKRGIWKN